MKASELRIGNYLQYTNDSRVKEDRRNKYFKVIPDDIVFLSENKSIDYVHPIQLTKEILLSCGFDTNYKKGYIGIDVNHTNFTLTYPCVLGEWQKSFVYQYDTFNLPRFRELRYLHELQNLFFALTGKELDCSFLESNKNQNNEESNFNQ